MDATAVFSLHPVYSFHSLTSFRFSILSLGFPKLLEELWCKLTLKGKHEINHSGLEFPPCHLSFQSPTAPRVGAINFWVDWAPMTQEILWISQPWQPSCWEGYEWTGWCLGRMTPSCRRARPGADAPPCHHQAEDIAEHDSSQSWSPSVWATVTSPGSCGPDAIPITSPTSCNSSAKWPKITVNRAKAKKQISIFSDP